MNRLSRPLRFGLRSTPFMTRFPARRQRLNRGFALLSMTAFVVAGGVLAYALSLRAPRPQIAGHARIIDGDSLMVAGTEVRLWGIDAPELFQRCTREGREVQCGREASRALIAMVAGQQVTCERRDMDPFRPHRGDLPGRGRRSRTGHGDRRPCGRFRRLLCGGGAGARRPPRPVGRRVHAAP
jgi:hypothetical protein